MLFPRVEYHCFQRPKGLLSLRMTSSHSLVFVSPLNWSAAVRAMSAGS